MLIDLSNLRNIDDHIKNKRDRELAMKYAEHYTVRYIKQALGFKASCQLSRKQLADAVSIKNYFQVKCFYISNIYFVI